jgi:death-on-curing protein
MSDAELHDFGLLESAVMRPQTTVFGEDAYPTVLDKAGALMHSLARNHAFVDGNKRTAVVATLLFLEVNGYKDRANDGELVSLALDAAEGLIDSAGIAGKLKNMVVGPTQTN